MQSLKFLFEFTGTLTNPGNEPLDKSNDSKIIVALNDEKNSIKREIANGLQIELTQFLPIEYPRVDINFENENTFATGILVIDFWRNNSGAVALFDFITRLVKRVTENAIKNSLTRKFPTRIFNISIQITPTTISEEIPQSSEQDTSSNLFNIPSSKLLIYITLIIMFFLGGTLFNIFQVDSVQKRYNEANQKYLEVKAKYDSASQYVNKTEDELQSVVSEVMTKKVSILSTLSSDTMSISSDISLLKTRNNRLGLDIESLNKEIIKNQESLNVIKTQIIKLQDNKTKFSCKDTWNFMDITLKSIIIIVFALIVLSFLFPLILIKINKNR